jgi:hypothetical protein
MAPADESLSSGHCAGSEIERRLIEEVKLFSLEGILQVEAKLQAVLDRRLSRSPWKFAAAVLV